MSTTQLHPTALSVTVDARPRFEGSNIRTWIGFKHLMYLVEEAVLQWFREHAKGAQALYNHHGLGLEIIDSSVQLPALVEIDDEVSCHVAPRAPGRFDVRLSLRRAGGDVVAVRGKVVVALVEEGTPQDLNALAPELHSLVVRDGILDAAAPLPAADTAQAPFTWTWTARYFHCHFSDRVQHSAYVRALEEVVDRFLAARGMSIRTMLEQRGWIPVVSRARVRLLCPARMEERIRTTFRVTEILRGTAFDGVMECQVERDGGLVPVATATILHGYAASRGPDAGRLVELDAGVTERLWGSGS